MSQKSDVFVAAAQTTFIAGIMVGAELAGVSADKVAEGLEVSGKTLRKAIRQAAEDYAVLLRDSIDSDDSPVMHDIAAMRAQEIVERAKQLLRDDA